MNESTHRLKQKLEQLTVLDSDYRIFGSREVWGDSVSGHLYQLNPIFAPDYVERGETYHGLQLPQDYKDFLIHVGNGGAGPHYGMHSLEEGIGYSDPSQPFPFAFERIEQEALNKDWRGGTPGIIQLNDQGCGYYSFLVVKGEAYGTVWTDWTQAAEGLEPTHQSFSEWFEDWLDRSIGLLESEQILQIIQPGMNHSEVVGLVGRAYQVNKRMDAEGEALVFAGTASSVLLNPQGQVEAVRPNVFA